MDATLEHLKDWGADTEAALARFCDDEGLYIICLGKFVDDSSLSALRDSIRDRDYEKVFDAAHTVKGVTANLGLTPLTVPASAITELTRHGCDETAVPQLDKELAEFDERFAEYLGMIGR